MLLAGTVVIVVGSQSCCWPLTRVVSWDSCCGHGVSPAVDHLLVLLAGTVVIVVGMQPVLLLATCSCC